MTKALFNDPRELRRPGEIKFKSIPVNQYQKTVKDELNNYTAEEFIQIYHDMRLIREFETMLNMIKTTSAYQGIEYTNPGPAHLSIGQEAASVGQAFLLDKNDAIFGSHRSHGEIIAKAMSCIHRMDEAELEKIMTEYMDGRIYKIVLDSGVKYDNMRDLAKHYVLYGMLAEIFARDTGFNRGLGGSMHGYFLPFGIYPNNAIVGGSADIATGAALYNRVNQKSGIVIANIGDASMGCGPVWEAITFSAMDQYKKLWEESHRGGLPLIFNFMNNQYGMGGETRGETMGFEFLARVGAGVNPEQMHAERVDGYNPLAVIDAMRRKIDVLKKGEGPVLLDILTYRYSGHSPSDADSYRTQEEKQAWEAEDSIQAFAKQMLEAGVVEQSQLDAIEAGIIETVSSTLRLAIDPEKSPRMDLRANPLAIESMMFSNERIKSMDPEREPEFLMDPDESPRVKQIARKARYAFDEDGKPVAKNRVFQIRDALFEAVLDKFKEDATLVAYGEENRDWGGAFAVYRGLTEVLPYYRLFNSSISEAAIVGTAVGYAMRGGRALVELMYCDFLGRAGDEVFNQLPKWQAMSGGLLKMPVVVRVSVGSKYGAQHSQDWTSLCAHIPGLKVCFPVTPYDAKGMLTAALNGTDPVIFFESQRIYDMGEQFVKSGVPVESYEVPLGEPALRRSGSDLTILTIGATLYRALEAAEIFAEKYGISVEVIDARTLVPFNYKPVIESVKKTGKIIVAGDACERGSFLNDLARNISDLAFDYLDAPVTVLGSRNWITPAHELEGAFFPQPDWFLDIYHQRIAPLEGYVAGVPFTDTELVRRARKGV
ncbi:MAG: dehydrogenase [Clostridiaceae bacterium]|nr:dehydrogenase [Clostridiaceae bacterium]